MGILQALKNGFGAISKNIKLLALMIVISIVIMVISIPMVIAVFGQAVFQPGVQPTPEQMRNVNWALFVPFILLMILIQTFVNAGVVGSIKDIIKTNSFNLGNFLTHAKSLFVRFILFTVLVLIIMLVAGVVMTLIGAIIGAIGNAVAIIGAILGILLALLAIVVFVFLGIFGSLGPVVIAAEDTGTVAAMGKAVAFIKANKVKVVGLSVILWIGFVLIAIINNISAAFGPLAIVIQIVMSVVNIYLSLAYIASFMSLYLGTAGGAQASA